MLIGACSQSQWRAALHPGLVAPHVRVLRAHPRGRAGPALELARIRIGLDQHLAGGAVADLVLVQRAARAGPGMNSSHTPLEPCTAIGCTRPSQRLKSPTTLTRSAFGAQTAKRVAADAVALLEVAAQRAPGLAQAALVEQIQIMPAQHRREGIGIVQLAHVAALAHAQHVGRRRAAAAPLHSNRPARCTRSSGTSPDGSRSQTASAWGWNTRRRQPSGV